MKHDNHVPPEVRNALRAAVPGFVVESLKPAGNSALACVSVNHLSQTDRRRLKKEGYQFTTMFPSNDQEFESYIRPVK